MENREGMTVEKFPPLFPVSLVSETSAEHIVFNISYLVFVFIFDFFNTEKPERLFKNYRDNEKT